MRTAWTHSPDQSCFIQRGGIMANVVIMPKQGQSVESCIVVEWHKDVGDSVKTGDLLFSYETDKAAFDYESEVEGVMLARLAKEGDDVPCLQPVCVIGQPGEDISGLTSSLTEEQPAETEVKTEQKIKPETIAEVQSGGDFISPRARKTAERQGADASLASPTGPGGRIIERDIYRLSENGPAAQKKEAVVSSPREAAYTDEKLSNVRKIIARTMHESLANMAQLTNNSSFNAKRLLELREQFKREGRHITINDMILYAVAKTLLKHPSVNAHFLDDKIRLFHSVNLGMAVDTERGLLVPTIYDADKKSLDEISKAASELVAAAKSGKIDPELLANGTFTVTNLGALGVESFTPIINPPQTAILGVCAIQTRVKESGGGFGYYPSMVLSLTYDHRAVDGAPAARFIKDLGEMMENLEPNIDR